MGDPSNPTPTPITRHGHRPAPRRLRVLAVTRIFPNAREPFACAFQRQQLVALARRCDVEVMAGVPYLPFPSLLGDRTRAGRLVGLPVREEIEGIQVVHPQIPYVPGAGLVHALATLNAPLYVAGLLPHLASLRDRFDVVLGTYLFPDGVAAAALARMLGLPYAIKTHGTDVNVTAQWSLVRRLVVPALRDAAWVFGVSRPMVDALVRLGARPERAVFLPNGVDRSIFRPIDRTEARRALGLPEGRVIVYVGRLEKNKGTAELLAAFEAMRETRGAREPVHLVLVGEGSQGADFARAAARIEAEGGAHGHGGRLIMAGSRPLLEVAQFIGASDLLVLPSWAEGTPNVVLEALGCGRPVVATRVGGIPDAVAEGRTGMLVPPRDARALAVALVDALDRSWDEAAILATAPPSWDESAASLHRLLAAAAQGPLLVAA